MTKSGSTSKRFRVSHFDEWFARRDAYPTEYIYCGDAWMRSHQFPTRKSYSISWPAKHGTLRDTLDTFRPHGPCGDVISPSKCSGQRTFQSGASSDHHSESGLSRSQFPYVSFLLQSLKLSQLSQRCQAQYLYLTSIRPRSALMMV